MPSEDVVSLYQTYKANDFSHNFNGAQRDYENEEGLREWEARVHVFQSKYVKIKDRETTNDSGFKQQGEPLHAEQRIKKNSENIARRRIP